MGYDDFSPLASTAETQTQPSLTLPLSESPRNPQPVPAESPPQQLPASPGRSDGLERGGGCGSRRGRNSLPFDAGFHMPRAVRWRLMPRSIPGPSVPEPRMAPSAAGDAGKIPSRPLRELPPAFTRQALQPLLKASPASPQATALTTAAALVLFHLPWN